MRIGAKSETAIRIRLMKKILFIAFGIYILCAASIQTAAHAAVVCKIKEITVLAKTRADCKALGGEVKATSKGKVA